MGKVRRVCVAGTFDRIHAGHEALLRRAFEVGVRVLIGITSDSYVSQYKSPKVRKSLRVRKQNLRKWLVSHGYLVRSTIVPIDDPYEPAVSDPNLEALIVSEETCDRGEELNRKRVRRGLTPLVLIVVPLVPAHGKRVMPESLRSQLSIPLGKIINNISFKRGRLLKLIITVGDVTTDTLLNLGIVPKLMVIDRKVNRKPYDGGMYDSYAKSMLVSGPGFIADTAEATIRQALNEEGPRVLDVSGEEDLLVLPVISEAPLGARVYYGQPGVGMIEVTVTKNRKKKVIELLSRFI